MSKINFNKILVGSLLLLFIGYSSSAQNAKVKDIVCAGGGISSASGTWMTYSIGDIAVNNVQTNGDLLASNGFQQPINNSNSIQQLVQAPSSFNKDIIIYPNPTNDLITIKKKEPGLEESICVLYDLVGKVMKSTKLDKKSQKINLKDLPASNYFLTIYQNGSIILSTKIQKL